MKMLANPIDTLIHEMIALRLLLVLNSPMYAYMVVE